MYISDNDINIYSQLNLIQHKKLLILVINEMAMKNTTIYCKITRYSFISDQSN